jgi:hypothetical protein
MKKSIILVPVLVVTFLLGVAVAVRGGTTSADLVGEWSSGRPSHADWRLFTFRADHSWNGIAYDVHGAGKWKLHDGKKLELIYYSDYEHKIISNSKIDWILIESIIGDHMRLRWYEKFAAKETGKLLPPEVWTRRR